MFDAADKEVLLVQLRVIIPYLTQIATIAIEKDEMIISSSAIKAVCSCNDILCAILAAQNNEIQNVVEIDKGVIEIE